MFSSLQAKIGGVGRLVRNTAIKNGIYAKHSDNRLIILMYHGIDAIGSRKYNNRFYSVAEFEKHIQLLKRHTNILSHEEYKNGVFSKDRLNVVITFDDGYENNLKYAVPVLEKYKTHAYFFITGVGSEPFPILWADTVDIVAAHATPGSIITVDGVQFVLQGGVFVGKDAGVDLKSFIKSSSRSGIRQKEELVKDLLKLHDFTSDKSMDDYWKLMTEKQIQATASSDFITVGSHGYYHNNLGSLSLHDGVQEVMKSCAYLRALTGKPVDSIAYPDGSYTVELSDALLANGVTTQFLVSYKYADNGRHTNVRDRLGLYPYLGNPNETFYRILKGA